MLYKELMYYQLALTKFQLHVQTIEAFTILILQVFIYTNTSN